MSEELREMLKARTKNFALRIINLYDSLPTRGSSQVLGHQLLRSGTSVGANYREGIRARSTAEFRAKLGDSLKELEESGYWMELLVESQKVPGSKLSSLINESEELIKMFVTILSKTKPSR